MPFLPARWGATLMARWGRATTARRDDATLALLALLLLGLVHAGIQRALADAERVAEAEALVAVELGSSIVAESLRRSLDSWNTYFELLESLAQTRASGSPFAPAIEFRLRQLSEAGRAGVFQAAIIDADGYARWSSLRDAVEPTDARDREYFQAQLQPGHGIFVSEPVRGRVSQRWSVQLSRRIVLQDGSFAGVGVVSLDPDYLSRQLVSLEASPYGQASLFRLDGLLIAAGRLDDPALPRGFRSPRMPAPGSPLLGKFEAGPGLQLRFISRRFSPGLPLLAAYSVPVNNAMAAFYQLRRAVRFGEAGLALLILCAALLVRQRRQSQQAEAARELAQELHAETSRMLDGLRAAVFLQIIGPEGPRMPTHVSAGIRTLLRMANPAADIRKSVLLRAEPPVSAAERTALLDDLRRDGHQTFERSFRCDDGTLRWMRVDSTVIGRSGADIEVLGLITDIEDQKAAERALAEAAEARRAELEALLDGIPGAVHVGRLSPDGSYSGDYMSRGAARLLGLPPGTPVASVMQRTDPPQTAADRRQEYETCLATGMSTVDRQLRLADGTLRWVRHHAAPLRLEGNVLHVIGLITDVEAEKQAQAAVLQAADLREAALKVALNGIEGAVYYGCFAPDGSFQREFISTGARRLLRLQPEDTSDNILSYSVLPPTAEELLQGYATLLATRRLTNERQIRRPDGTLFWSRHNVSVLEQHGDVLRVIGLVTDVTDEKQAQQAVAHAAELRRAELARVLDGVDAMVSLTRLNPAGRLTRDYVNASARWILRAGPDAAYDDDWLLPHIEPPLDTTDMLAERGILLASGRLQREHQVRRGDGSLGWVRAITRVIGEADGSLELVHLVLEIDDEKAATAAAIGAARLASVGELAAGLAHEMNQPLAVILLAAELAQDQLSAGGTDTLPFVLELLDRIVRMTGRARDLTGHLRLFTHSEDGPPGQAAVAQALEGTLVLCGQALRDAGVQVETALPDDLPMVVGKQVLLEHVLVNLLLNARDALAELPERERRVCISAEADGQAVVLTVADSGPGVPATALANLFRPFFTTKPAGKGTGLGLSICQGILQPWGGNLGVGNAAPGEALGGARMTVTLRIASPEDSLARL